MALQLIRGPVESAPAEIVIKERRPAEERSSSALPGWRGLFAWLALRRAKKEKPDGRILYKEEIAPRKDGQDIRAMTALRYQLALAQALAQQAHGGRAGAASGGDAEPAGEGGLCALAQQQVRRRHRVLHPQPDL